MKNIVTKLSALGVSSGLKELKKTMDYKEIGGAPLLGITKPVIKAHGSSDPAATKGAIRQAYNFVRGGFIEEIAQTAAKIEASLEEKEKSGE